MNNDFIEQQKKLYKSLGSCLCNVLDKEVSFTADGLNHILYYKRRPRNYNEKYYRAALIVHLVEVIENAKRVKRTVKSDNPKVVTWALEHEVSTDNGNILVKVILRRIGGGNIHFFSVMAKRKNTTKKPKNKS